MPAAVAIYLSVLVFFLSIAIAGLRYAPWVPSRAGTARRALSLAGFVAGESFTDLGSGDGRVVIEASLVPGCSATGIEITWLFHTIACIRRWAAGSSAKLVRGSLFDQDLGSCDIVFTFGTPSGLGDKMVLKLRAQMRPGARLVSRGFEIPGLRLAGKEKSEHLWDTLFLYTF